MGGKTIAVVDRYRGGHHQAYATFFCQAIEELGFEVVPFLPTWTPAEASPSCQAGPDGLEQQARALQTGESRKAALARALKRCVPRVIRQVGRTIALTRTLRRWEAEAGRKIDTVFFACIYDWDFDYAWLTSKLFPYAWTGLYLQANSVHGPNNRMAGGGWVSTTRTLFSSPRCQGIGLLDKRAVAAVRHALPAEKRVVWLPDVTDQSLPARGSPEARLAEELAQFAQDRPIVSLVGAIKKSKGLELFSSLAADPRMQDVCFFLGGEVSWVGISPAARREIEATWQERANLMRYLGFIPGESAYNAVLKASDVVFAAYEGFPHSSNTVTKAACLRVPLLCTQGGLMGDSVDAFGLGETIPEQDLEAAVIAVRKMLGPDWRREYERTTKASEYAEQNSQAVFRAALAELLA